MCIPSIPKWVVYGIVLGTLYGGFHSWGYPIAGWFLVGKIPSRNGWWLGGTPIYRNHWKPPYNVLNKPLETPINKPMVSINQKLLWPSTFQPTHFSPCSLWPGTRPRSAAHASAGSLWPVDLFWWRDLRKICAKYGLTWYNMATKP